MFEVDPYMIKKIIISTNFCKSSAKLAKIGQLQGIIAEMVYL
jgi:hypothetical protein